MAADPKDLQAAIDACTPGTGGWRAFEDACVAALAYLFVPPLVDPRVQARTISGLDIRDAVFPNRETDSGSIWGTLWIRHKLIMLPFEFKNYDSTEVGKDEVDQLRNYMRPDWGGLGAIVSRNEAANGAKQRAREVFQSESKIVLLFTATELKEMIRMKERGDDPALFFMEKLETFYLD